MKKLSNKFPKLYQIGLGTAILFYLTALYTNDLQLTGVLNAAAIFVAVLSMWNLQSGKHLSNQSWYDEFLRDMEKKYGNRD